MPPNDSGTPSIEPRDLLAASASAMHLELPAFVNMEGFFLIPDHAKGHVEEPHTGKEEPEDEVLKQPLPEDQREVTAVLIRTAGLGGALPEITALDLLKPINKELFAQAIQPIKEIYVLNSTFVRAFAINDADPDGLDCRGRRSGNHG